MNDVFGRLVGSVIVPATFEKDVSIGGLACDTGDPRVLGHMNHFHRFWAGSDTLVDVVVLDVDLDGPTEVEDCHFQEGQPWNDNNASGITYTIFTDDNQTREDMIVDTDGDGFPDHDELFGVDTDCDGREDIFLNQPRSGGGWHDVLPDPNKKDLYVEVDWMDCDLSRPGESDPSCDPIVDGSGNPDRRTFEPHWPALDAVVAAFEAHDITLHIMPGEAIPVIGVFNGTSDYGLTEAKAQVVYDLYFGTDLDRAKHEWHAYRKGHARYGVFNFNTIGGSGHGNAFAMPSDMFRVAYDPAYSVDGNPWDQILTPFDHQREQARLFMHELGHSLGLRHGGSDDIVDKPNQFSVMTYRLPRMLDDWATPEFDRVLDYNAFPNILDACSLSESEPIAANSPTDWALSWQCPDNTHRGSGSIHGGNDWDCDGVPGENHSGTLQTATCLPLYEIKCVGPGQPETIETIPGPGDVYREARIWPGPDGVLNTPMDVDAAGNPLDVLTLDQEIIAGPDGILSSAANFDPRDEFAAEAIHAGPDFVCNTIAVATDVQVVPPGLPTSNECRGRPCNEIEAIDEWSVVATNLVHTGNFSGAYQGPPLPVPVEPNPEDVQVSARRSARADVGLSSSFAINVGNHGRQVELAYDVVNFGPHAAVEPTVEIRLSTGSDLVRCEVPGGTCYQHGNIVVAGWEWLPANETASLEVQVLLGCDAPGGESEITAHVHTVSFDPDPANNDTLDSIALEPALEIGEFGHPWVKSWANNQPMPVVQSDQGPALALTCGYQAFESPAFDTYELGAGGTELLVDVYIPPGSWAGWVGDLTLFFEAPGLNIWNRAQGTKALTPIARGQWVTLSFSLDSVVRDALLTNTPSARFRLASNLGGCGMTVKLGQVRVGGLLTCQPPLPATESIASSSVLRFESLTDWSSPAGTVALESTKASEGSHAVRVGPAPWMRLESRMFETDDLESISNRLALDVLVPELPAGETWLGGLGLLVDCPDAGLYSRWIGYHALQFLFGGEFNRLEYSLPSDVVTALETPGMECRIAFELSSNPSFGSFVLDGGGFLPEVP